MPKYMVAFEIRDHGSIGIYEWKQRIVSADSKESAIAIVFCKLHEGSNYKYDTRAFNAKKIGE